MAQKSKFVQVATSSQIIMGLVVTIIHALDEEGEIWQYQYDAKGPVGKGVWVKLSSARK